MNRIDALFRDLRSRNAKALMPFVTAGDPDLATTAKLLQACQRSGGAICELGFPFSDPIADGPVIQASMTHALGKGIRPGQIIDMVKQMRASLTIGVVAMVSYSIVHKIGTAKFIADSKAAGIDGFIFPDLPVEECEPASKLVKDAGLIMSLLIAPTTPIERARKIAQASSGFVYVLARAGITGVRSELPPDLTDRIADLRKVTDLPIAVGFGIATAAHVKQVCSSADAAIVGSAIMRRIADQRDKNASSDAIAADIESFVKDLAGGLK